MVDGDRLSTRGARGPCTSTRKMKKGRVQAGGGLAERWKASTGGGQGVVGEGGG